MVTGIPWEEVNTWRTITDDEGCLNPGLKVFTLTGIVVLGKVPP